MKTPVVSKIKKIKNFPLISNLLLIFGDICFRAPYSGGTVFLICLVMLVLSVLLSAPLFFTAAIEPLLHASFPGFPDMLVCTQKWTDRWRIGYKIICILHFFLPIAIVVSGQNVCATHIANKTCQTCTPLITLLGNPYLNMERHGFPLLLKS